MGTGHLGSLVKRSDADNIKVLAVSDVYQRRSTRAKNMCQGDGISITESFSTEKGYRRRAHCHTDHWHGKNLLRCMDSGKHVYVEKP